VIALEIRDFAEAAWKAYRAHQVVPEKRRIVPEARRSHLSKGFAPSS
jgi:hypothetical protein